MLRRFDKIAKIFGPILPNRLNMLKIMLFGALLVCNPLKSSVTGPSLLANCYLFRDPGRQVGQIVTDFLLFIPALLCFYIVFKVCRLG